MKVAIETTTIINQYIVMLFIHESSLSLFSMNHCKSIISFSILTPLIFCICKSNVWCLNQFIFIKVITFIGYRDLQPVYSGKNSHYLIIPFQANTCEQGLLSYMKKNKQSINQHHNETVYSHSWPRAYILIFWTAEKHSNNWLSFTQLCILPTH